MEKGSLKIVAETFLTVDTSGSEALGSTKRTLDLILYRMEDAHLVERMTTGQQH